MSIEKSILPPNEHIVYVLRKTGMSKTELGKLNLSQFYTLLKELYFQENVDRHNHLTELALLLSTITNAPIPRKAWSGKSSKDFYLGDMPTRDGKQPSPVDELAKKKGVKIPSK